MGWPSAADLADNVWAIVKKHIPEKKRKKVARKLIKAFEEIDCDGIRDECFDLMVYADWK